MTGRRQLPLHPVSTGAAAAWIAMTAGSSVVLSLYFACVTPFVALAAVSAMALPRQMAIYAVLLAWLGNQMVGYLILGYPQAWDSYAWGLAIGVAAATSLLAAFVVIRLQTGIFAMAAGTFLAAFVVYEGVLFAATSVLPSGQGAFSIAVISQVLVINAAAAAALALAHFLAAALRLLSVTADAPILQ